MATSTAQLKANKKYQQKFDRIQIRVSPEEKAAIDQHAEKIGISTNTFVRLAIKEAMERDQCKQRYFLCRTLINHLGPA